MLAEVTLLGWLGACLQTLLLGYARAGAAAADSAAERIKPLRGNAG